MTRPDIFQGFFICFIKTLLYLFVFLILSLSYFSFLSDLTRFLFKSDHLYCFDVNSQNTRVFARKNPRVSQREGKNKYMSYQILIILQTNKKNKMIIKSILKSILKSIIKPLHNNNNLFFYFFKIIKIKYIKRVRFTTSSLSITKK